MTDGTIPSVIGRLLAEVSWDGSMVKRYRHGGRRYENVLMAECFQALDFLPRANFIGAVLRDFTKGAEEAVADLIADIEQASFDLLPGNRYLKPSGGTHQNSIAVQPDGIIETERTLCLIEAKRISGGAFQSHQLAKEYLLVTRDASTRTPLLLLILGHEPPVKIQGEKRMSIGDSIRKQLDEVYESMDSHPMAREQLHHSVDSVVAWTTWRAVANCVEKQLQLFTCDSESIHASVRRLANSLCKAIKWHE